MLPTKAKKMLTLLILAALPAFFLVRAGAGQLRDALPWRESPISMESALLRNIPFSRQLQQFGMDLRLFGGQREQNGIFISEEGLLRRIDAPVDAHVAANSEAVVGFAQRMLETSNEKKATHLAVLPTAIGVQTQGLPRFAQSQMTDQQRKIEEMYNRVSGKVKTIDVYSALYNRRGQYLYYRTEDNLTALGGYYAYAAIARRLEISNRSLSQFDIEYVDHAFYGSLYGSSGSGASAPYRKVKPDTISLFRYDGNRQYIVTKHVGGEQLVYHTPYPVHRMDLGDKLDVYLGGAAAITDIRSSAPGRLRLLVFSDKTGYTYLPFFSNHYQQVTMVDLEEAGYSDIAGLQPEIYDQVLIACGIETYTGSNHLTRLAGVTWPDQP